ncbi:substrate-binding periplasmic protein [Dyella ginsengisoli]|uniref:substrate-binding periplasmic protein n=1 Tax=Dyella ginsengisoli TaxID=363848 RepID=UPI0003701247|nr:transporter substrate-binding domain-containing protein [Dyella ginsengisoli]
MSFARHLCAAALISLALVAVTARAATPLRVIYPVPGTANDPRESYPLKVLHLALERSGEPYMLKSADVPTQQARSLRLLEEGEGLDIVWSVTSREREHRLLPIRIPIDRGLFGWRVLLIRPSEQARMDGIRSVAGLARLWGGQGHDWPDLAVLQANGLRVVASPTYEGLFAMLRLGRIDYFPRAISEAQPELAQQNGRQLTIEKHLLLHYPSAQYFFVNPRNHALAEALTRGLERAIADGSMRRLFESTYGSLTRDLGLSGRVRLELANPDFPADAPLDRPELWFSPSEAK